MLPQRLPVALRCAIAGVALAASVPPWGWWPAAFLGIAEFDQLLAGQARSSRVRRAVLVTLAWLLPAMLWMWGLTPPGYILASLIFSVYVAIAVAVIPSGPGRRPALVGALTLMELVRWYWPFGGVPLAHLAMSQAAGPLLGIAGVVGSIGLVATVLTIGVSLSAARDQDWVPAGVGAGSVLVLFLGSLAAPSGEVVGELDVAVVQGGGPQRTVYSRDQGLKVLDRHLEASDAVPDGMDLVLWPENVINAEPVPETSAERRDDWLYADDAERELSELAVALDSLLIPGWVEDAGPGRFFNYSTVYDQSGERIARYDKVRLVPFGEFVPFRSLIERVAPDSLPKSDAVPGTEPAVLSTPEYDLGIVISWEVFFPRRARDAIGNGGEVLLNPTNGSSYWLTQVQTQQVASSILRGAETGRWVLQAAPTGFSAVISPDGEVLDRTGVSEQRVLVETIERRTGNTIWVRTGPWPTIVASLLALLAGWIHARRHTARDHSVGDGGRAVGASAVPDLEAPR